MINKLVLVLKGMCMGAADVVPGVSGGTMALIMGIYQPLISAIRSFDWVWAKSILRFDVKAMLQRPHFGFLIPLMMGILFSVIIFTRIIPLPILIKTHPELIYGLFFGLILASIVILLLETRISSLSSCLFMLIGIAIGFLVFTLVPAETPNESWFIFVSGAIAICAMILPGISGSFLLLMMKKYSYILNAIGHFNISVIIPFALGAACGLMVFSRVLSFFLHNFYHQTMALITGLLVASLWVIWPFQQREYVTLENKQKLISSTPYIPEQWSNDVLFSILCVFVGVALVAIIHMLGQRFQDQ